MTRNKHHQLAFKEKKKHLGVLSYSTSFHPYIHVCPVSHLEPELEPRASCQLALLLLQAHMQDGAKGKAFKPT